MSDRFTGGDHLSKQDGLKYYIHNTMMLNELAGGSKAYEVSNAKNAASGPSFGAIQYDLGGNTHGRRLFEEVAHAAVDSHGVRLISDVQLKQIQEHLYQPFSSMDAHEKAIYNALKPKMDEALSSPQGKALVNADYDKALDSKVNYVHSVIDGIKTPENKAYLQHNMTSQVMIADIKNQYGDEVNAKLAQFLDQTSRDNGVHLPHGRTVKVVGALDSSDITQFRFATAYGINHHADAQRRENNISSVVGAIDVKQTKQQPNNHAVNLSDLSPTTQSLHASVSAKVQDLYAQHNQPIDQGTHNTAMQVTVALAKKGATGIERIAVKDGHIHAMQMRGEEAIIASVNTNDAANTPTDKSLSQLAAIDNTQSQMQANPTQNLNQSQSQGRSIV